MPVAAAQLVLLTAAEDAALVGDEGFASALPLAASGPGEPFVTAAGVLGLMCAPPGGGVGGGGRRPRELGQWWWGRGGCGVCRGAITRLGRLPKQSEF